MDQDPENAGHEIFCSTSYREASALCRKIYGGESRLDVALIDLHLGDGSGADLVVEFGSLSHRPRIAIVSGFLDASASIRLWQLCTILVPKPIAAKDLCMLVAHLASLRTSTRNQMLDRFASLARFSPQQRRLFEAMLEGKSGKEAAEVIGCFPGTARRYMDRIFDKLGCRSQREVIAIYAGFVAQLQHET